MNLGELIKALESLPKDFKLPELCNPHLHGNGVCFEFPLEIEMTVEEILKECKNAIGKEFSNYLGENKTIVHENTPVFVTTYGYAYNKITGISVEKEGFILEDE